MSKFDKWFCAQCGPRPSRKPKGDLIVEAEAARAAADMAENILNDCIMWDREHEAALYAWQVKDEAKQRIIKNA